MARRFVFAAGLLLCLLCSVSSIQIGGREVTVHQNFGNFYEALAFCAQMGKQLMVIKTEEEFAQVEELGLTDGAFWVGATYEGYGRWVWAPTGDPVDPKWWRNGRPRNPGEEKCVEVHFNGGWKSAKCSKLIYVLCQETEAHKQIVTLQDSLNTTRQRGEACASELAMLRNPRN